MPILTRAAVASALTTAAVAAGSLAAIGIAPSASAAAPCIAYATLPARVALADHPVTVTMTLRGSAGCDTGGVDNGATATLRGPGAHDPQRWARFGRTDTETFQVGVDRSGTYTLRNGDVQVYNSRDQRVASQWRATSVVVKRASRVRDLHRRGSTLSGLAQTYRTNGWSAQSGADLVLQKQTGASWQPVVREHATRAGRFDFTGLRSGVTYRVVGAATATAWGATSRRV